MRARSIKPGFFSNELLAELAPEARLLFIALWCLADRDGRLEDRPKRIKMQAFPADAWDIEPLLQALHDARLIVRYEVSRERYIEIPKFHEHQRPHANEKPGILPPREEALATKVESTCDQGRKHFALNPSSLNPDCGLLVEEAPTEPSASADLRPKGRDPELEAGIVSAYHEILQDLPKVRDWNERRKRKLRARISERVKAGKPANKLDYWTQVFRKAAESDFLMGRKTDWRCPGLEWLLEPKNFTKLIEGAYDNHGRC